MAFWDTVMDSRGDVPFGKRLLPVTIDEIAAADPDRLCFSFPRSPDPAEGFRDMDFGAFAGAINKMAHFIHREIGRSSMFESVMYMGFPDVRHFIVLIALMKTGHKALFSSHRNSIAGHAELIRETECTILLHSQDFPVSGILEKCRMETLCIPDLDFLLQNTPREAYPYDKTWEEAKDDPCLVVHTSGSMGLPKPVVWTHYALNTVDAHHLVAPLHGRRVISSFIYEGSSRVYNALPIFHGAGVAGSVSRAVFNRNIIVIGPPGQASADTFDQVLEYGNVVAAHCLAATLEEVATRPDILAKLQKLKHLLYLGGALSQGAGDMISRHVPLYNLMGSTKTSILVHHATDREDWQYVCLNPIHNGIEMRPKSSSAGLYELVFVKNAEQAPFQTVFKMYPKLKEYSMSDLYSKHPTKPHHWKHEGRKDDLIVFSNGWNFNPIHHEFIVRTHPAVQNCVLVGNGKSRPAAIIELRSEAYTEDESAKQMILEAIWPKVQEANMYVDTLGTGYAGYLAKDSIIFGTKEKPLGKGTVDRKATVHMYMSEIEALYALQGEGTERMVVI